MCEVVFYEDENGKSDTYDYVKRISQSHQKNEVAVFKKLVHQIKLLKMLGTHLNEPQAKYLKGYKYPLWELRPLPERVFYGTWQNNKYIILNHYTKKQDKTDPKEIRKAVSMLEDWYERNGR